MKVTLIQSTSHAKEMIILSQSTRLLENAEERWEGIINMTDEQKQADLEYAFKTISGSFEFVHYTFLIEGVTRALTHQLVRYRIGTSFAQQSQMFQRLDDLHFAGEDETGEFSPALYRQSCRSSFASYNALTRNGVNIQVARGVLPTNTLTNMLIKINLRSLMNMLHQRLCLKIVGEYQALAHALQLSVLKVHPWSYSKMGPECLTRGVCIFPSAKKCFIRDNYMEQTSLDGFKEETKSEIRNQWKLIYGFDPQPHSFEEVDY